jgi:hypothetical protein
MRVRGVGIDTPRSPSAFIAQAGPRLAAQQGLGEHFFVLVHADALATLTRWTVTLNQTDVWTTPRFAGMAGLDVGVRFR